MTLSRNYANGRAFERRVGADLEADGYRWILAAGSKGRADLWAAKPGQLLLIQVKRTDGRLSPADRAGLLEIAHYCRGLPIVAYQPVPRKPILYRLLTGPGPSEWEPWVPDELAAAA